MFCFFMLGKITITLLQSLLLAYSELFWGYSHANEPLDIDNGD